MNNEASHPSASALHEARSIPAEAAFWKAAAEWQKAGSGMTSEQETGAAMVWSWLDSHRRSTPAEALDPAASLARQLDVDELGRAFHEVASHGGPLTPCGYVAHPSGEYIKVGYNENGAEDEYACLCKSIATAILARLSRNEEAG